MYQRFQESNRKSVRQVKEITELFETAAQIQLTTYKDTLQQLHTMCHDCLRKMVTSLAR